VSVEKAAPGPLVIKDVGLQTPESVQYDASSDVYLVSNINGNPGAKENKGFISRITAEGKLDSLHFIQGGRDGVELHGPLGSRIRGDTLWDVAGRAGKRCLVFNIPNTYPARPLEGMLVSGFVAVNLERAVYPASLLPALKADGYKIDVDYVNADQKPDAFFADTHAVLDARRRVYLDLIENEAWDLFIGVITECDRLHHYFWSGYADPASALHAKFLDVYRRLDDVLGELVAALPAGVPLFIVADHGHTLIHREYYPNAWLRQQGLLRFTVDKPKGPADLDPASKVFVLDPGRIYVHRKGRFPLGTVDDAEAADLLGRVREGLLALRDDSPGAPADGRPVSRIFARDELYHGPALDAAPDAVIHFNDGYDPKGALSKTEVFGRSALTGMHTYADSLFFVNRPGVPTDGLDIIDLAPPFSPSSASMCRVTWTVACGSAREAPARPSRPSPAWGRPH